MSTLTGPALAMRRYRWLLLSGLVLSLALAAVWWLHRPGFATPGACLEAYYDALAAGDATTYLRCLGDALRSEAQQRFPDHAALGAALRGGAADLKNRVQQGDGTAEGADRIVEVEEVRTPGIRRVRFRLRPSGGSWFIVGRDAGPEVPASVPYGTHISKGSP